MPTTQRCIVIAGVLAAACTHAPPTPPHADRPVIDRFSARAGHLLVRDAENQLPAPDQPIDLDRPPFITRGLGPDGRPVRYYNFDIQSPTPAIRYRFAREGSHEPLAGQDDVVDAIPGGPGYSDFWRIAWVGVPSGFVAGSIHAASQLGALHVELSPQLVDCPIVPRGSTAREAHGVEPAVAEPLWYRGARVTCLRFGAPLTIDGERVPTSPIYVTFASEAGPPSGFRTEPRTAQTHNVVLSLPGDVDYSPLWDVHVYDRAAFGRVINAETALAAPLATHGPLVNCPVVSIGP